MIRLILALLFAILYLIIGIPVLGVEWIIANSTNRLRLRSASHGAVGIPCDFIYLWNESDVIGEENVPKDQAVLYIGNHRSYFDIIITYARCPRLTGYIAKRNMEKCRAAHLDAASALSVYRP